MIKKITSVLAAAAMAASCLTAVAADIYSTDAAELKEAYTVMTDSEKTEFVDKNLSKKDQHLSRLAAISSTQATDKIADEVNASLADGLTAIEIKEALYHSGAYCGYTRAAAALDEADKAIAAAGEDITYSTRITSTEAERYNDGLAVQRYLFGSQIGTITEGMSEAMKLQSLYLSGICFGDFYNRQGLPLYTREFLTFCTIAGNGNCQGQLTGHTNGNLNVGHSTDMLRAAIIYNADIYGEEKTLQALGVLDSVTNAPAADVKPEPTERPAISGLSYKSDSEELLATITHYDTDDKDGYIPSQLTEEQIELVRQATLAVVDGTEIPTSADKASQLLIDIAKMTAEGGRESEIPAALAANIAAGNTAEQMLAVSLACVRYNGFPRTLNMMTAINNAVASAAETQAPEQSAKKTVITMRIDDPTMTINGTKTAIDAEGTVPVIVNDRTLMPVRAFVEGIGGSVEWDGDARKVTLTYEDRTIELVIDSTDATLNGNAKELDTAPVIINDRTMLPIRFIAESFGFVVSWDGETKTVTVEDALKIENVFDKGGLNPAAPHFTGISYLNFFTQYDEAMQIPSLGLVTFEPCTRTDWHIHDGGQILLVTEGVGVFGMEGAEPRLMQAGDVILIPPGVRHFHSAINDSQFAHIALGVNPTAGTTNWFEKVTDSEYDDAVAKARANGEIRERGETMFPKGEAYTAEGYTGTVYKNLLVEQEDVFKSPEFNNYTMEAGARTAWHSNESGELIVVTDGVGVYQEEGKEPITINAGDIITAQPGINHWYGAAGGNFAYIGVNGGLKKNSITWGNTVTDEEHAAAAE